MYVNSVIDLLQKPFKSFTTEEQLEIVKRGRFTDLVDLSHSDKGRTRNFSTTWYQKVKWLSGDAVNKKLYCWYCLLFPTGTSKTWNKLGFDDLRNFSQATKKHEESREHIYATVKTRLLYKKIEKRNDNTNNLEKNIEVKRNREYLERLIDISSILTRFEVPFRKESNADNPFKSLVHLFKKYDDIVRSQLELGHNFHGFTETTQIGLVQSIQQVVLQKITEEVSAANVFSLIVDELNSDPETKNISISIRYIKNGEPVERFLGLFQINYGTKAEDVTAILDKELEKFNYKDKMISQSYDGKVVKATELYSLQQTVKRLQKSHCQAQLVHYYAHDFRVILAQSLNSAQECKMFFCTISLFCKFFQNLNIYQDDTLFESIPASITTLQTQYNSILRLLEYITTDEQYEITSTVVADAFNLINHLKNLKFTIFLTIFDTYFSIIQECLNGIKTIYHNTRLCRKEVVALIDNLKTYKIEQKFNDLIKTTIVILVVSPSILTDMFQINVQILDSLIHEIEGRFLDIELADFSSLVSLENFMGNNQAKKSWSSSFLMSIKETYPKFFDLTKLKNDLELFYGDPSIGGFGEVEVKQIQDILKFLYDNDLKEHLPELYKLLEFVVTVPSIAEPLEGNLCVLNRIEAYRCSSNKDEPRSGLALLVIEKDLLLEIENSEQFYSQVIDHFSKLPISSSIELLYNNQDEGSAHGMKRELIICPDLEIKSEVDMF